MAKNPAKARKSEKVRQLMKKRRSKKTYGRPHRRSGFELNPPVPMICYTYWVSHIDT